MNPHNPHNPDNPDNPHNPDNSALPHNPERLARLRTLTLTALEHARALLIESLEVRPFLVVSGPLPDLHVPLPLAAFENSDKRAALFAGIADAGRAYGAEMLVIVTDSWTLSHTPEQQDRIVNDPAYNKAYLDTARKGGMAAAAAAGFGDLTEMLTAVGQSIDLVVLAHQKYHRYLPDGRVPGTALYNKPLDCPHEIRFPDPPEVRDTTEPGLRVDGALFKFYEGPKGPLKGHGK